MTAPVPSLVILSARLPGLPQRSYSVDSCTPIIALARLVVKSDFQGQQFERGQGLNALSESEKCPQGLRSQSICQSLIGLLSLSR